jgi:hypothetical protein
MSERKRNGLVVCKNNATYAEKRRHSLWARLGLGERVRSLKRYSAFFSLRK